MVGGGGSHFHVVEQQDKSSAGGAAALTVELERGARVEHAARAGVKKGSTRATIAPRIVK